MVLATLVAVMVTRLFVGRFAGARYRPVELIVPVVELPPVTPLAAKVTAVFVRPVTVTKN